MDPNTPSGPSTRSKLVDGKSPNKGSHLDALHRSGESRGNVGGDLSFLKAFFEEAGIRNPTTDAGSEGVLKNTVFLSFDIVVLGGFKLDYENTIPKVSPDWFFGRHMLFVSSFLCETYC